MLDEALGSLCMKIPIDHSPCQGNILWGLDVLVTKLVKWELLTLERAQSCQPNEVLEQPLHLDWVGQARVPKSSRMRAFLHHLLNGHPLRINIQVNHLRLFLSLFLLNKRSRGSKGRLLNALLERSLGRGAVLGCSNLHLQKDIKLRTTHLGGHAFCKTIIIVFVLSKTFAFIAQVTV